MVLVASPRRGAGLPPSPRGLNTDTCRESRGPGQGRGEREHHNHRQGVSWPGDSVTYVSMIIGASVISRPLVAICGGASPSLQLRGG